ncbi:MAG: S1/P1 nuclease [Muribaculaceae bacterium]|nr:S1/P1 nuclease [Muribaculaceae bacterium]
MKRNLLASALLVMSLSAFGWGQKGHDTTAYIAEKHLTPTTRAAVDSILEGRSMVYWANWLDNASHTPAYAYTKTWHYKNVDKGERYEEAQANPAGDAVVAIKHMLEVLSNPDQPFEEKQLAMKILVHVTGDLHMPLHMGHATDLGGNRITVKYFGRDQNLHSIWDSALPESAHKWGYTEWTEQIDRVSPDEAKALVAGSIDDWAKETISIADAVYDYFPAGTQVSYNDVAYWTPFIEQQFLVGGLRLAHLLNTLYDPEYNK